MRGIQAGVVFMFLVTGCGGSTTGPSPLPQDLASAPTRVVLAGKGLTLEASLWRDFMPISPPDGKPLIVGARVKTDDGSDVPAAITADMLWVLNGSETWSTTPRQERPRSDTAPVYEVVAREGPKWTPGIAVDVVVRLRDAAGGSALLRVPQQRIQGTY